jgi:hypothetical protein
MDYCGKYWALIYDQFNHGRHEKELGFYLAEARECGGRCWRSPAVLG